MLQTVQVFDQYKQWDEEGKLPKLVKRGVLTPSQYRFYIVYDEFRAAMKKRFANKGNVVCDLCEKHKIVPMTFYRARRFMEQQL